MRRCLARPPAGDVLMPALVNVTGDLKMEQFHILPSVIANDIERFTAAYEGRGGVPWNSQLVRGARKEQYVVKLWNDTASGTHLCWARFDVRESDDSTVMDSTVCSESHAYVNIRPYKGSHHPQGACLEY